MKKYLPGILFLAPALILFLIFTVYPIVSAISLSFYDAGLRYKEFVGLANFRQLIDNEIFWKGVKNTLKYVTITVPPIAILPLAVSVLGYRLSKTFRAFLRFAFYVPTLAAGVVISIVWRWIFHPLFGLANYVLGLLGIGPVMWLGSSPAAFYAICIVLVSSSLGINVMIYMAALSSIPVQYYDAAKIDGCRPIQETWHITVPLMMPVIGFVFIKQCIAVSQIYQNIYVLTSGGPYYATTSIVYMVYHEAFKGNRYGSAAAMSMMLLLMILVFSLIQAKFFFGRK